MGLLRQCDITGVFYAFSLRTGYKQVPEQVCDVILSNFDNGMFIMKFCQPME